MDMYLFGRSRYRQQPAAVSRPPPSTVAGSLQGSCQAGKCLRSRTVTGHIRDPYRPQVRFPQYVVDNSGAAVVHSAATISTWLSSQA